MDDSWKLPPPVTLRDLVRIVRRRALLAVITFIAVVTTTLLLTSRMQPVYQATSRVLMDGPNNTAAPSNILDLITGANSRPLDAEMEKIKSRNFLTDVIHAGRLRDENAESLKGRVVLAPSGGGQILDISVRAKTAADAKKIADLLADHYIRLVGREYEDKADVSEERLRRARDEAYNEKNAAERNLNAFLSRAGMSDPSILYRDRAVTTVNVRNQLEESRRQLILQRQALADQQKQLARIPPERAESYTLVKNPVIDSYRSEITRLGVVRQKLRFDYAEDSDEVKAVDSEIRELKRAIADAEKERFSPGSRGIIRNPDYARVQSAIFDSLIAIKQTEHGIESLTKRYAELEGQQKTLTEQQNIYEGLKRKRDAANEAYEKARLGLINMRMTRVMSGPNLRVLEDARLPEQPLSPKPLLNLAMAITLGLFLGFGFALLAEYLASGSMIETPEMDFPRVGGVPLLGAVPVALPGAAAANPDGLPAPVRPTVSATDTLREIGFSLAHRGPRDPVPIILLAGTRSDDATAAVAAQIAATLVRDGVRVTLIDADRAQPRLNHVFGAPDAPGLADVLAGRHRFRDILHIGANGSLRFLSAGSPDDPTPMSDSGLRRFFREMASDRDTDLVLVSGPSVWQAPIIAPLEKAANGLVLVTPDAGRGITPAESVARARRLLTNGYKPNILGVIVNTEEGADIVGVPAQEEKIA
ncbi:MAG: GNVR domain-containing protein [Capsulimonadales bacterium]|nr:GNVR domain-containing protein [Capsulimonadales bacterium]